MKEGELFLTGVTEERGRGKGNEESGSRQRGRTGWRAALRWQGQQAAGLSA